MESRIRLYVKSWYMVIDQVLSKSQVKNKNKNKEYQNNYGRTRQIIQQEEFFLHMVYSGSIPGISQAQPEIISEHRARSKTRMFLGMTQKPKQIKKSRLKHKQQMQVKNKEFFN